MVTKSNVKVLQKREEVLVTCNKLACTLSRFDLRLGLQSACLRKLKHYWEKELMQHLKTRIGSMRLNIAERDPSKHRNNYIYVNSISNFLLTLKNLSIIKYGSIFTSNNSLKVEFLV